MLWRGGDLGGGSDMAADLVGGVRLALGTCRRRWAGEPPQLAMGVIWVPISRLATACAAAHLGGDTSVEASLISGFETLI